MRRNAEIGVSVTLVKIPMREYWRLVLAEVNRTLAANYEFFGFIAEVYHGNRTNKKIDSVLDACVDRVNQYLKSRGLRSKNPIVPRVSS